MGKDRPFCGIVAGYGVSNRSSADKNFLSAKGMIKKSLSEDGKDNLIIHYCVKG